MNLRGFLAIEASLTARLVGAWQEHVDPLLHRIHDLLLRGDSGAASDLANELDLTPVVEDVKPYIDFATRSALLFGATRVYSRAKYTGVLGDKNLIANANRLLYHTLLVSIEDNLRIYLLERIADIDLYNPTSPLGPRELGPNAIFKFDENQPRAPAGESEGGQWIKVYHGTIEVFAKKIKETGLLPQTQHVWKSGLGDNYYYEGDRAHSVFVTQSISRARSYAQKAADHFGHHAVAAVVELKIPKSVWESGIEDEKEATTAKFFKGGLDAKYVKAVHALRSAFKVDNFGLRHSVFRWKKIATESEFLTIFAPLVIEAQIVQKFDPQQPRGADGRWVLWKQSLPLAGSLNISRKDMPQLPWKRYEAFKEFARSRNVNVRDDVEIASRLKPTQNEYNPHKMRFTERDKLKKPLIVSRDNYVLDGTHRMLWFQKHTPAADVPVVRIDLRAHEALALMHDFPHSFRVDVHGAVQKRELGEFVEPFISFQGDVFNQAEGMLGLVSALHTSRLSAYGFMVEADVRGLDRYEINAQLDKRICPVCEVLDGRSFPVESARRLLTAALGADDPQDLKTLQPWPPQDARSVDEIAAMSEDDLIARGWNVPPLHPFCRCVCVKVGEGVGADETPSAIAARAAEAPLPLSSVEALSSLTAAEIEQARESMLGLSGEDAAQTWQRLIDEFGFDTEELEALFGVAEEDVLAGDVSF